MSQAFPTPISCQLATQLHSFCSPQFLLLFIQAQQPSQVSGKLCQHGRWRNLPCKAQLLLHQAHPRLRLSEEGPKLLQCNRIHAKFPHLTYNILNRTESYHLHCLPLHFCVFHLKELLQKQTRNRLWKNKRQGYGCIWCRLDRPEH